MVATTISSAPGITAIGTDRRPDSHQPAGGFAAEQRAFGSGGSGSGWG